MRGGGGTALLGMNLDFTATTYSEEPNNQHANYWRWLDGLFYDQKWHSMMLYSFQFILLRAKNYIPRFGYDKISWKIYFEACSQCELHRHASPQQQLGLKRQALLVKVERGNLVFCISICNLHKSNCLSFTRMATTQDCHLHKNSILIL